MVIYCLFASHRTLPALDEQRRFDDHSVKKQLKASRIKRIYVSKDDNPSIAIKPYGAWLVPNDYSIKFAEDREGERQRWELLLWAEEHDVPVVQGRAIRWL